MTRNATATQNPIRILLVAPNVSMQMGGEALKALHIMTGLRDLGLEVIQLTHARVRNELAGMQTGIDIRYIEDGPMQIGLHKLHFNWPLAALSSWLLHRAARKIAQKANVDIVHFTSPISPTLPYFGITGAPVVIGPLNGNILHPPAFMHRETRTKKLGAAILSPFQKIIGSLFRGKRHATLLVSGGERTVQALLLAGCSRQQIVHTLDSGVDIGISGQPRLAHKGENYRFVFAGRLIRYKACDLVIRALQHAPQAELDVVGDGDERAALELLAQAESVADRVHFHGWVTPGEPMRAILSKARSFLFPTLAEANGIVVQEAMMIGLPVVAVNWGGPAALLDADTGILIEPVSENHVILESAAAMIKLGSDAAEAERLSANARAAAEKAGFAWADLLDDWVELYRLIINR